MPYSKLPQLLADEHLDHTKPITAARSVATVYPNAIIIPVKPTDLITSSCSSIVDQYVPSVRVAKIVLSTKNDKLFIVVHTCPVPVSSRITTYTKK